jgi:hypothetical protein
LALAAIGSVALVACGPPATRDVILVARGMSFFLESHADAANPVIPLRAGDHVRVVLRNEAPGLLHDFVIPDWGVSIPAIRAGEQREVTFSVPDAPGRVDYRCRPHSGMMSGFIEVTR